jgi:hypothetical protein
VSGPGGEPTAYVETVSVREVEVEAHEIVGVHGGEADSGGRIRCMVGRVPLSSQAVGYGRGEIMLVLDDQDAHDEISGSG